MRRTYDVVALITGVVFTAVALGGLWLAFVGPLPWPVIKIVAPLGLVVLGVCGLALSRNRPKPEPRKVTDDQSLSPTTAEAAHPQHVQPGHRWRLRRSGRVPQHGRHPGADPDGTDLAVHRRSGDPLHHCPVRHSGGHHRPHPAAAGNRCSTYAGRTPARSPRPRRPSTRPTRTPSGRAGTALRRGGRRLGQRGAAVGAAAARYHGAAEPAPPRRPPAEPGPVRAGGAGGAAGGRRSRRRPETSRSPEPPTCEPLQALWRAFGSDYQAARTRSRK